MAKKAKLPTGLWLRGSMYWSRIRVNGKSIRKPLSTDKRVAIEMLDEMKVAGHRSKGGLVNNDVPLQRLLDRFVEYQKQSGLVAAKQCEAMAGLIGRFIPGIRVSEIDADYIIKFRAWLKTVNEKMSPSTINKYTGLLSNVLNRGVEWKVISHNPIIAVKRLPVPKKEKVRRALTNDELESLYKASTQAEKRLWKFLVGTGARLAEALRLTWGDVDLTAKTVTILITKNKKPRTVPLSATLYEVLQDKPKYGDSDLVFLNNQGLQWFQTSVPRVLQTACRRAGMKDAVRRGPIDVHSLRVTFATLAIANGADIKSVQSILGHSTVAMTLNIYAKATDSGMREAVELASGRAQKKHKPEAKH